jgi:hypothetical protein
MILLIIFGELYDGVASPQTAGGRDGLQIWRVAAYVLNKQSLTADKGWSSSLGVGRWANNSQKEHVVTKCYIEPLNSWSTLIPIHTCFLVCFPFLVFKQHTNLCEQLMYLLSSCNCLHTHLCVLFAWNDWSNCGRTVIKIITEYHGIYTSYSGEFVFRSWTGDRQLLQTFLGFPQSLQTEATITSFHIPFN